MGLLDNSSQVGSLTMSLIVSPLVVIAIILRFIATRRAAREVGVEDWFALLAAVSCVGFNVISIWCIAILDGREFWEIPLDVLQEILKASYICTQFFPLNQFFAKLSILCLYHRIFGVNKRYSFWIITLGILQTCWTVAAVFTLLFQCKPVNHYWDIFTPGTCIGAVPLLVGFEVPNSTIDFAMVSLALVMLRDLQMRSSTKWKLSLFFAAGGFCGIIGFVKIAAHFTAGQNSGIVLSLWGNGQMLLSIFCCCVPIYHSLFTRRSGATGRGLFSFTKRLNSQPLGSASSETSQVHSHPRSYLHSHSRKATSSSGLKPKFSHSTSGSVGGGRRDSGVHPGGVDNGYGVSAGSGTADVQSHLERKWEWLRLPCEPGFGDMTVSALVSAGGEGYHNSDGGGREVSYQQRQTEGGSDSAQAGSSPGGAPMKTVVVHQSVEIV